MGTLVWHSWSRLPQLRMPVKIVHGELDRLIPVANAGILANRIPNSRTFIIPGAGHVFTTDQPEIANREAISFLEEMSDEQETLSRLA
jgi:pimeloyl-ACP methyl ester carboxylesterase